MILRPFSSNDWPILSQNQYPGMPEIDIQSLIAQWNTRQHDGRYFEMLAIDVDGKIIGYVSLYAQDDGSVSEGVEIYTPFRRQGFAYTAASMLFRYAKDLGYQTVTEQIRQDNVASLALHDKLGFRIADSFINKRGNPVHSLVRSL